MRKIFIAILLIFICHNVFSQIKVKEDSFHQIDGFVMLDKNDHYDDNNRPMALIKIATENIKAEERRKFIFKGNMATYFDVHFEPGEIWLYLSTEATFIEIIHDDYGKTEFVLPYDLKGFCGYEMVVQYVPLTPQPEAEQQKKFHLIVKADQADATIYIDEEALSVGEASKLVNEGTTHTYKIECKLYHSENGSVTVNEKTTINKTLRPNFGYINISTSPEQGAKVFIDGDYIGESPITTDKLASGTHTVRVMKDMYKMKEQSFTVTDGQTTNANITMTANFVTLTINTDADSDIYVDEEYRGKGKWTGRVSEGFHNLEARKQNHKNSKKTVDLVLGENKTITLDAPKPINGSIEINSSPMEANIYIDGKSYGTTPNYVNEILIGTHELKLEKQGCAPITKTINVKEGETLTINEKLHTGKEIVIKTDKSGDKIYVDDNYVGLSPVTTTAVFGSHNIKAERNGKYVSKTITVETQNFASQKDEYILAFVQEINGHEYVDLGLSVKWATCNVGANKPEDYGNYYEFRQYDRANWGGSWRLPTKAELEELKNKCTWEWTKHNGVKGYKVTGPNGNSIFLLAAGYRDGSSLGYVGSKGFYWSSTPYDSYRAYYLNFSSVGQGMYNYHRSYGQSVRLVAE